MELKNFLKAMRDHLVYSFYVLWSRKQPKRN